MAESLHRNKLQINNGTLKFVFTSSCGQSLLDPTNYAIIMLFVSYTFLSQFVLNMRLESEDLWRLINQFHHRFQ